MSGMYRLILSLGLAKFLQAGSFSLRATQHIGLDWTKLLCAQKEVCSAHAIGPEVDLGKHDWFTHTGCQVERVLQEWLRMGGERQVALNFGFSRGTAEIWKFKVHHWQDWTPSPPHILCKQTQTCRMWTCVLKWFLFAYWFFFYPFKLCGCFLLFLLIFLLCYFYKLLWAYTLAAYKSCEINKSVVVVMVDMFEGNGG